MLFITIHVSIYINFLLFLNRLFLVFVSPTFFITRLKKKKKKKDVYSLLSTAAIANMYAILQLFPRRLHLDLSSLLLCFTYFYIFTYFLFVKIYADDVRINFDKNQEAYKKRASSVIVTMIMRVSSRRTLSLRTSIARGQPVTANVTCPMSPAGPTAWPIAKSLHVSGVHT